ncbi:MAG TPA: hypothetical protein PLM14_06690 [Candidatus Hydrogenedentes bacterium]|nr:hypothetical protein [Candidatus Hydrogenedentota bacterium]
MTRIITALAAILSLAAGASAEVTIAIAPDQPIPHVYIDDVLVLELRSDRDIEAHVRVAIQDSGGAEESALDTVLPLPGQSIRWVPLENVAGRRGRYLARVTIEAAGETQESTHPFCRIDRPASMVPPPVAAIMDSPEPYALLAMRDLPLGRVCFDAVNPELDALVEAANEAGLDAAILIDLAVTPPETATTFPEKYASRVAYWSVHPGDAPGALETVAAAFAERNPVALFSLVADTPETLSAMLRNGAGRHAAGITLRNDAPSPDELEAFDLAAQTAGYERLPLQVLGRGIREEDDSESAARLVRNLIVFASCGVAQADIDGKLLVREKDVTEGYVFLSALARRLAGTVPIGSLDAPAPFRAHVFRLGDSWLIAAWSEGEAGSLSVPVGDAAILELADASNNPLPAPPVENGAVSLAVTAAPVYLKGEGGNVLAATARRMMQLTADSFASNKAYAALLPEQVMDIFQVMRKAAPPRIDRSQFLALLPMFPLLEAQWHTGAISQEVAVPAMSALSEIIRHAAVIEQAYGEPFVQPLQDTLASCAEFQQDFLTRAETPPETRSRADWLMAEVTRLVAEAKQLDQTGRSIEANAVASLARWKARSLKATLTYAAPGATPSESADGEAKAQEAPSSKDDDKPEKQSGGQ